MRNDLYITVERGEFEKGGKSVARNVEVTMLIVESGGQTLKVSKAVVLGETVPCHRFALIQSEIS